MTFFEQAASVVVTLVLVAGFIGALVLSTRAGRKARLGIVALSWVLAVALYRVIFFALPEGSGAGYVSFMVLAFVFAFAFWGLIDLAIHSNVQLRGGEKARFLQGVGLLVFSLTLFVAAYFVPDWLEALPGDAGFGAYLLGVLGVALAAILCLRAGARALYANRAAVPGLLSARKATVEVAPEKASYLPGESVRATVMMKGRRDFEVAGARAELLYTSSYSYLTPDPRGGSLLVDGTDREVVAAEDLPIGGTVRKGKTLEHEVTLDLPERVPPTGKGEITGVTWAVGVVLEVPGGPDVRAETPITVLSARETHVERFEGETDPPRSAEVKLRIANPHLRAGERVEGSLVVTPREAFGAGQVRVELVRRELVRREDGNVHETIEARETLTGRTRFHPQTSQAYAFGLEVPGDLSCPSSETARTYVGWFLRGVLTRGPRPDHAVEQELNVFGGPRADRTS